MALMRNGIQLALILFFIRNSGVLGDGIIIINLQARGCRQPLIQDVLFAAGKFIIIMPSRQQHITITSL
jgi:hypothetical protein